MKKIIIPVINKDVKIYVGDKEKGAFNKECENMHIYVIENNWIRGSTAEIICWVKYKDDIKTYFHELTHVLDNIFRIMGAEKESEFKAYVAGYLYERVFDWLHKSLEASTKKGVV